MEIEIILNKIANDIFIICEFIWYEYIIWIEMKICNILFEMIVLIL